MAHLLFALVLACVGAARSAAATLPRHFEETTVFSGLVAPTSVRFASDGRVFVAEKSGLIKIFDNLSDSTPTIFADFRTSVHNFWDRGLLGLALHPSFPAIPYVYIAYTLDAAIGGVPPRWGTPGSTSDPCPQPPGGNSSGCLVAGRLSRLEATGNAMAGSEVVLLEDWCQQFPSHSVGSLTFGPDGALYMSAGDGASFTATDYGQFGGTGGVPRNPCGDPPVGVGGTQTSPAAEGGALRSQDLETLADPVGYDGTILRLDPLTGAALPDNPLFGSGVPGADRVVAYGLRNPFRMTVRPGTSELWLGEVGWNSWEEINRLADALTGVTNFGWPCYEGNGSVASYAGLDICTNLDATPTAVTGPFFAYNHGDKIVAGEACGTGSSAISGLAFYQGGNYPPSYEGALFFTDYNRRCIWAILPGAGGEPDPATRFTFASGMAGGAVDLQIGPGGDLFFADYDLGRIRRISYTRNNQSPTAVAQADVTSGAAPLTVHFDGSASTDPDPGDVLTYAWDLDGDRVYDDSTAVAPVFRYTKPGTYMVGLEVSDGAGGTDVDVVSIAAGNTAPSVTLLAPAPDITWQVSDVIEFSGRATDAQDGALPPSAFTWKLSLAHCPSDCHLHTLFDIAGVANGSFPAPDHDYPSSLELKVTVTDSGGLTDTKTVVLQPETVDLQFASVPPGLTLIVGPTGALTPFTRRVIVGSVNSLTAPSPQRADGVGFKFSAWTDGGAQSHDVTAPGAPRTYTAIFRPSCGDTTLDAGEECDDGNISNGDCCSSTCQLEPSTTVCRAAAGPCDRAETCTGTSPACPADTLAPPNAVCRPGTQACDVAERCTGTSVACPADRFAPATVVCRPEAGACDVPETCTGTSAACPTNRVALASIVCRPGAGPCDMPETCTGTSGACPPDVLATTTLVCRPAAAVCDAPETCTGTSTGCPADGFAGAATVCREAAGPCDVVERCTGTSSGCPADGFAPPTAECRPGTSVCDVAEKCTGASAACPPNGFAPATVVCRSASSPCDAMETCSGTSAACPVDRLAPEGTECRAAAGLCDVPERCAGTSSSCPLDDFVPRGSECRATTGPCDVAETCTGTTAVCPPDGLASEETECRAAAGPCDEAERCTGADAQCPADRFVPTDTLCRAAAGECDLAETCTGASADCPVDAKRTLVCRPAAGECDAPESCDGTSDTCPADVAFPDDDLDGLCNPIDPCTDGSRVVNAQLVLGRLGDPGGDEKLVFKGELALGAPLDPTRRGIRVLLEDATRKPIVDILVPGATYDRNAKRGWRPIEAGWKYINRAGLLGLRKIVLRTSGGVPGRLHFSIKGKDWNYRVAADRLPVSAILVLAPPTAGRGECGEAAFPGSSQPRCGLSAGAKTLRCK